MKSILFATAILLALFHTGICQIPNNSFELWEQSGDHLNPVGWWCSNDSVIDGNNHPIERSTEHFPPNSGSYSIRISNNMALLPSWGAFGIIWTGGLQGNDNPAFEVEGHPNKLYGYYKFLPENNDTFEIHIRLYNNGNDIGGGQFKTAEMTNAWLPFTVDISEYEVADSARIMLLACYNNDAPDPTGNSVLFIDNLSFDSLIVDGMEHISNQHTSVAFPNPAYDFLTLTSKNNCSDYMYTIVSVDGKEWATDKTMRFNEQIDIRHLPNGAYFLNIQTSKHSEYVYFLKQ
jgi:hypothetical protein